MKAPKPYREQRPWGEELWFTDETPSMVKILTVNPGEELSLQYHHNREEFWHIVSGDGFAQIGTERRPLAGGDDCFVEKEQHHRLIGGKTPLVVLELAFGTFDEKDNVRLEDKYGRA
jgi:mannose-6-phosphate isomerase-like protein (cupin superfamily)